MIEVSIGLRAKTGRAVAVLLCGPVAAPKVLKRSELLLTDPSIPATGRPYHEVMELPWEQARVEVKATLDKIEGIATESLANLIQEIQSEGLTVSCVGIVGAGDRNPERIGSKHIRAHAAEGLWYRQVLELAAKNCSLKSRTYDERKIYEIASTELGLPAGTLTTIATSLGHSIGRPWRADEKAAAITAWLALI